MRDDEETAVNQGFKIMTNVPESVIQEQQLQSSLLKNMRLESQFATHSKDRTRILINKTPLVPLPNPITREKERMDSIHARLAVARKVQEAREKESQIFRTQLDRVMRKESLSIEERRFIHEGIAQLDSRNYTTTYESYWEPFDLLPCFRSSLIPKESDPNASDDLNK